MSEIDRFMMATKAFHKLGDLSRDKPDLCRVYDEDDENYIGSWVEGLGFFNIRFPKKTTRPLTPEEIKHHSGRRMGMFGSHTGKLSYTFNLPEMDEDGTAL